MRSHNAVKRVYIFEPSFYKVLLASVISLLTILGWNMVLRTGNITNLIIVLYLSFSFAWIIISGIIASMAVYISRINEIARVSLYAIFSFIFVSSLAILMAMLS
jgi:hypothetical protein